MSPDRLLELARAAGAPPEARLTSPLADVFDSMAFADFLGRVADECAVETDDIETAVGHRFGTIGQFAKRLTHAGITADSRSEQAILPPAPAAPLAWLAASAVRLPATVQLASSLDEELGKPAGWFAHHTGIASRRIWAGERALDAAASAARECLAGRDAAALVVTAEAPPILPGVAAALHSLIGLPPSCPALEVGGACVGFLHALFLGQRLVRDGAAVLVVAVESPSIWLDGENAALFGDGAAACLLTATPPGRPLVEVALGCDGAPDLLQITQTRRVKMRGPALASRAVRAVSQSAREIAARHGVLPEEFVVHSGNGRMLPLLARRLGVSADRLRSLTPTCGNLGSASLPAAWAASERSPSPAVWAAAGAGLHWGAALFGENCR